MSEGPVRKGNTRDAQASEWLVKLREKPGDEATLSGWLRWCEADPANAQSFEETQRLWRQFDQVFPDAEVESILRRTVADDARGARRRSRTWWYWGGLVAAAGCAGIALFVLFSSPKQVLSVAEAPPRENRSATLPDGSAVELGAKTSIAVDFSGNRRMLHLAGGQAYFKVKPDKSRPFTVRAGELDVTAVGTAFDVNEQAHRIAVTVQEGVVSVTPASVSASTRLGPWRVASGYQFVYSDDAGTATLSSVDTSAVLAWREGRLEYTRAVLTSVVADINRYAQHPVRIEDQDVGRLTFTGTVFTDSIDDWVTALPGALPLEVHRQSDGTVLLQSRAALTPGASK